MDDSALATSDAELVRLASIDLNLLVPLLALLETRSVTRAAEVVGLSQPALSHTLRRLRRLLGDELLVRERGSMILTPRAEQMVAPVRRALQQSARALRPHTFDPATDDRTITIAMTTSTAFVVGPLLMRVLDRRAPHVTLRIQTTNMMSSPGVFTDDAVDVVLLLEIFASPHPRERLYDERWVVLSSPGTAPSLGAIELLSTLPHVAYSDPVYPQMKPYEVLDREGVPYAVRDSVSDYLLVPHLLLAAPRVCVHRLQAGLALREVLGVRVDEFPFDAPPLGVDMVWNPWLSEDPFRTWLREVLVEATAPLRLRAEQAI